MPVHSIVSSKLTKHFVERGSINAILIELDKTVEKKFRDLKKIVGFLSKVMEMEFAIIKMQPIVTHLGTDIDLLIQAEDIKPFLRELKKRFRISHVELHENTRKGLKATVHLSGMKLGQIEMYTYLGWYGYSFISSEELIKFRKTAVFSFDDGGFLIPVLPNLCAFIVDVMHAIFEKYISLGDLIKILLLPESNFTDNVEEYSLLDRREIIMVMDYFIKSLKACLKNVLSLGRCYIPLRYTFPISMIFSFKNLFINKELSSEVYWKELKRILNAEWQRLTKTI